MVVVEDNNGNAISCIVLMLDSLASTHNASVVVETLHEESCSIFGHLKERAVSNKELSKLDPVSKEALEHLYSCTCQAEIEAVFSSRSGDTLLIPMNLSEIRSQHPWLKNDESMQETLDTAMEHGTNSPLLNKEFKSTTLRFKEKIGHSGVRQKEITNEVISFTPTDPKSF